MKTPEQIAAEEAAEAAKNLASSAYDEATQLLMAEAAAKGVSPAWLAQQKTELEAAAKMADVKAGNPIIDR